ncbi:hypothetical protein MRX96_011934 [Rhipicephalus microplus]
MSAEQQEQPPPPQQYPDALAPDSCHSWVIAAADSWNVFCCSLLRLAMPAMLRAVGEAFPTSTKDSVAWLNVSIYSLAYTLSPVASTLSRVVSSRSISVAGAILVGAGQVTCLPLDSLAAIVPVIGLLCSLGTSLSVVVDEMALRLHFAKGCQQALTLYGAAFSLSAIVYPPVFLVLVDTYGLNGALFVSGALSFNGLAGSIVITRPVWLPPDFPLPPLYRHASDVVVEVDAASPTSPVEKSAKGDSAGDAKGVAAVDKPDSNNETDNSVGVILVFHCALTSLSVTAGAVVYDYAMEGDRRRSISATVALVSLGVGDLLGRVGYESLLATGEHRKAPLYLFSVIAVQAFLQGGVLFLMALAEEIIMLVLVWFTLGWLSSTLDMLPVPVMQRFVEPDVAERNGSVYAEARRASPAYSVRC